MTFFSSEYCSSARSTIDAEGPPVGLERLHMLVLATGPGTNAPPIMRADHIFILLLHFVLYLCNSAILYSLELKHVISNPCQ